MDVEAPVSLPEKVAGLVRAEMAFQQRSVTEMASALDLDRKVTLSRYRGEKPLTLTEVERLAVWLDVDPQRLLGIDKAVA